MQDSTFSPRNGYILWLRSHLGLRLESTRIGNHEKHESHENWGGGMAAKMQEAQKGGDQPARGLFSRKALKVRRETTGRKGMELDLVAGVSLPRRGISAVTSVTSVTNQCLQGFRACRPGVPEPCQVRVRVREYEWRRGHPHLSKKR